MWSRRRVEAAVLLSALAAGACLRDAVSRGVGASSNSDARGPALAAGGPARPPEIRSLRQLHAGGVEVGWWLPPELEQVAGCWLEREWEQGTVDVSGDLPAGTRRFVDPAPPGAPAVIAYRVRCDGVASGAIEVVRAAGPPPGAPVVVSARWLPGADPPLLALEWTAPAAGAGEAAGLVVYADVAAPGELSLLSDPRHPLLASPALIEVPAAPARPLSLEIVAVTAGMLESEPRRAILPALPGAAPPRDAVDAGVRRPPRPVELVASWEMSPVGPAVHLAWKPGGTGAGPRRFRVRAEGQAEGTLVGGTEHTVPQSGPLAARRFEVVEVDGGGVESYPAVAQVASPGALLPPARLILSGTVREPPRARAHLRWDYPAVAGLSGFRVYLDDRPIAQPDVLPAAAREWTTPPEEAGLYRLRLEAVLVDGTVSPAGAELAWLNEVEGAP